MHFKESNHDTFVFASLLNGDLLLTERICSTRSKFFLFRVDPISGELFHPMKQTESNKNCYPCKYSKGLNSVDPDHTKTAPCSTAGPALLLVPITLSIF